jgi:hypothetical protein
MIGFVDAFPIPLSADVKVAVEVRSILFAVGDYK